MEQNYQGSLYYGVFEDDRDGPCCAFEAVASEAALNDEIFMVQRIRDNAIRKHCAGPTRRIHS